MRDAQYDYGQTKDRIFDEARNADTVLVIGTKGGKPHIWSNGDPAVAQELLAQVFPSAVLPEGRALAGAGSDR